jgi:hypothetical protein
MQLRRAFARTLAVLLIGSLSFGPLAVSAAGAMAVADGQAMSSDMAMDSGSAAMDEMPCHQDKPDTGKHCPFMAICVALCCQAIPVCSATMVTPASSASRLLPPELARLDGISFPPPSRPPKA